MEGTVQNGETKLQARPRKLKYRCSNGETCFKLDLEELVLSQR